MIGGNIVRIKSKEDDTVSIDSLSNNSMLNPKKITTANLIIIIGLVASVMGIITFIAIDFPSLISRSNTNITSETLFLQAIENGSPVITLTQDITITEPFSIYNSVTIRGNYTITLSVQDSVISPIRVVSPGVILNGPTIIAENRMLGPIIWISDNRSSLTLNSGYVGGRIFVTRSGSFTLNDGQVDSVGVGIQGAAFTMNGGIISGSFRGVSIEDGRFIMNGGIITDNHIGVDFDSIMPDDVVSFRMNDGVITGNGIAFSASDRVSSIDFMISGGTISGNIEYVNENMRQLAVPGLEFTQ